MVSFDVRSSSSYSAKDSVDTLEKMVRSGSLRLPLGPDNEMIAPNKDSFCQSSACEKNNLTFVVSLVVTGVILLVVLSILAVKCRGVQQRERKRIISNKTSKQSASASTDI